MANVTNPIANISSGTDPQSLMEYMTRQKIYDSRFWKEECFGLSTVGVLNKAAECLKCVGSSFGGNSQPTKFISLVLKLLQLQPTMDLVEELIQQEEFKYVRVLGALYVRIRSNRPAEVYQLLEPLLVDYRKLRYRDRYEWRLIHVDEFIHSLLTQERVCGIALPRLTARRTLVDQGYLSGPYQSPIGLQEGGTMRAAEAYLKEKVEQGSHAAKIVWERRQEKRKLQNMTKQQNPEEVDNHVKAENNSNKKSYGLLFKKAKTTIGATSSDPPSNRTKEVPEMPEDSVEFWNEERAKLGLAPLKK